MKRARLLCFLLFFLTFAFSGCRASSQAPPAEESKESNAEKEDDAYVLNDRQKEILGSLGLPTEYEELSLSEKNAIAQIDRMLTYLEDKYRERFVYTGFFDGRTGLEKPHLTAYPESGDAGETVTVYSSYKDGTYVYTDDYVNVLAGRMYQSAMEVYAGEYFPEGIIVTEVKETRNGTVPKDGRILLDARGVTTMIYDQARVSKEQAKAFLERYADDMREGSAFGPSALEVVLMDSETLQDFNVYDFENSLLKSDYSYCGSLKIDGDGEITVREYGPKEN